MRIDLDFNESKHTKIKLTQTQKRLIRRMYQKSFEEIKINLEKLQIYDNVSSKANEIVLRQMADSIKDEYRKLGNDLNDTIEENMVNVSKVVVEESANFAKNLGFNIGSSYYSMPTEIVNRITTGKIYEKSWSLSKQIWQQSNKINRDINTIIAKGITLNKTTYEIAKELERYVNPNARKDWEWSKVYPGTNRKIDYNAQRLARTLVAHAYEQSIINTTRNNPFVKGIRWLTSNSHRICPICLDRDGKIYEPDELPLDHPNGMCTFEAVIEDDMETISNRIADWYNGKEDFDLDNYANSLK